MSKDQNKKTRAKRMGLKSIFSHGDRQLTIAAFGQGNDAQIAVNCDRHGEQLGALPCQRTPFTIKRIDNRVDMTGHCGLEALINNPADNDTPGEDYLRLKGTLEEIVFGTEFPGDNVRIQIIHNILDIQKIIGLYINDVIYCVNNMQEVPEGQSAPDDMVGLAMSNKNIEKNLRAVEPYFGFFGDAFQVPAKGKKNPKQGQKRENKPAAESPESQNNASALRVLGEMRQITAHFKDGRTLFLASDSMKKIFKLNWDIVAANFQKRVERINNEFQKHSANNLRLIWKMLEIADDSSKEKITTEYYQFCILKEGKNLGLSMKKLRELMIAAFYPQIKDKQHDSYRQKLYTVIDYVLFHWIRQPEQKEILDGWVARLRECPAGENESLYAKFAEETWKHQEASVERLMDEFKDGYCVAATGEKGIPEVDPAVKLTVEGTFPLVQILSFLCNFMDGKEINELLTAYIHKFENIQSFIDTLKELGEEVKFGAFYALFNEKDGKAAGKIAKQLRVLASIGKMKPDMDGAKRVLYKAAIKMLGVPDDSEKITDEWLEQNLLPGNEVTPEAKKSINPFRNFVARNVISSRRFTYLVRYTKPESVRALMNNRKIIRYVLTRIPPTQVESYYKNIAGDAKDVAYAAQIDALANRLMGFSFNSLDSNRAGIVANSKEEKPENKNVEIERLKALTGLYLTVAFVAIKNLVKANARYYIAFAIFERDYNLFEKKLGKAELKKHAFQYRRRGADGNYITQKDGSDIWYCEYPALTQYFLAADKAISENRYVPDPALSDEENKRACFAFIDSRKERYHYRKRWQEILRKNVAQAKAVSASGLLLVAMRNHAEHLNVLRDLPKYVGQFREHNDKEMQSYFELYHFLLQKMLTDLKADPDNKKLNLASYTANIEKFGTPSHDLIKIAYVSLAYNLARYKNLTVDALFDKDNESAKKNDEKEEKPS